MFVWEEELLASLVLSLTVWVGQAQGFLGFEVIYQWWFLCEFDIQFSYKFAWEWGSYVSYSGLGASCRVEELDTI